MGEAIGQLLPLAVVVALSPPSIVAVVLILVGDRGRVNAPAFVAGWIFGLVAVGLVILAVAGAGDASDAGEPAPWVRVLKLVLGVGLLGLAYSGWRGRSRERGEPPEPKWMGAVGGVTAVKAAGVGVVLSALNPKNIVLTIAAGAAIAQTGIPPAEQAIAYAVFVGIAALGIGAPVVVAYVLGARSRQPLDRLRGWMTANNAAIMAALMLVIGAMLIGDAIGGQ